MTSAKGTIARTDNGALPVRQTPDLRRMGVIQRKCGCQGSGTLGECAECKQERGAPLQRASASAGRAEPTTVPPIVHEVLRSPGEPLDAATRAFMEPRFGHDFSTVRVHADGRAAESAHAVNAMAYTVGRNVVFGSAQYTPRTMTGGMLLAHELAHVVQQRAGRVTRGDANGMLANDPQLEQEADQLGAKVTRGEFLESDRQSIGRDSRAWSAATVDEGHGFLRIQRKETPGKTTEPKNLAVDFEPTHSFYEVLAHEFAYQGNLRGTFLYKAEEKKQQPKGPQFVSNSPATGAKQGSPLSIEQTLWSGIPGVSAGTPAHLPDGFAFMSTRPDMPPPPMMIGGKNPPLYYEVQEMPTSDPLNARSGFAAFCLYPQNRVAPKIIAFRGTDPKAPDIVADADTKGVGRSTFELHKPAIKAALTTAAAALPKSPLVLVGHSLGGALAQWTAADPELTGFINEVVTFNSPGISKDAASKFAQTVSGKKGGPAVHHYVTRGDMVSTAGGALLPGQVTMMEGDATRKLEGMFERGEIKQIGATLHQMLSVVRILANVNLSLGDRWRLVAGMAVALKLWGGYERLNTFGPLVGALHRQRLLGAKEEESVQAASAARFGGVANLTRLSPMPLPPSPDAEEEIGTVTLTEKQTSQINVASIEAARSRLNDDFINSVVVLFTKTIPLINALMDSMWLLAKSEVLDTTPAVSSAKKVTGQSSNSVGPMASIAKDVEPLLTTLIAGIDSIGGLDELIRQALYYQPKPEPELKGLRGEYLTLPDHTKYVNPRQMMISR
jgi:pimeloyl-ACP methyl ester carboxylesterase